MGESVDLNRASRIRLALSTAAAELADRATGLARTDADGRPGDVAEDARSLAATAEYVLQLAVLYDRRRGASWATVGEALGARSTSTQPALPGWMPARSGTRPRAGCGSG